MKHQYKTWIEIDKKAAIHNIGQFRSVLSKNTKLFAVVKSNAYGHGLTIFSKIIAPYVDGFCVDSVAEGLTLRGKGIKKPILVMGPTLPSLLIKAADSNLMISISNFDALEHWLKFRNKPQIHIKIDTGMHRQGFYLEEIPEIIKLIKNCKLKIENYPQGIFTHFASAKDLKDQRSTLLQIKKFNTARELFLENGFKNMVFHSSATGGTLLYPQAHFDLVRVGLGLYGYFPTSEVGVQHRRVLGKNLNLKPVLSWKAVISEVKELHKGDCVGYDFTEKIYKKTKAAIIPVGYWHGFPRSLSSKGEVILGGKIGKVLGRVSMDLHVVKISDGAKVRAGNVATLLGEGSGKFVGAERLGDLSGTTSYEALTRLNPLIQKVVV